MTEVIEYELDLKRQRSDSKNYVYERRYDRQKVRKKPKLSEDDVFMDESRTVIIDNGGYTIKTELATSHEPLIIPNCIMKAKAEKKRLFIGNQIDECRDCSGLFYLLPCERGYITKWEVQKPIWDQVFNRTLSPVNDKNVLLTQPLFNFKSIQDCIEEIFFEEYEVSSMYRCNPSDLVALKYGFDKGRTKQSCIVVDSGYSFTNIIPYINGVKCSNAIKRLQIGGKMLTNHMKDILSYRQYHVMEETYVINQVKEDTCFVSENFKEDLKIASEHPPKNNIVRNYILPDFNSIRRGYIQDPEDKDNFNENCQVLRLNNERFAVPEILFTPSDIGISSVGLVDCLMDSIKLCPKAYQGILAENIIVVGGNALLPGFKERLVKEFQSKMLAKWTVGVTVPKKPMIYAWQGGKSFLKQPGCNDIFVTKKEYEEEGSSSIQRKFNEWATFMDERPVIKSTIKPVSLIDHVKSLNLFKKDEDSASPLTTSPQEPLRTFIADHTSTPNRNTNPPELELGSPPPLSMFDEKTSLTPPPSEISLELSASSESIVKTKSSSHTDVKYFFECEDSEEENPLQFY